jgi:hypothetical protein
MQSHILSMSFNHEMCDLPMWTYGATRLHRVLYSGRLIMLNSLYRLYEWLIGVFPHLTPLSHFARFMKEAA